MGKKWGELVSSYDDGEQVTVPQPKRFKVVFTRLFYVLSACLSAPMIQLPRSLNKFGALSVFELMWRGWRQ